jgi:leucyl aminopeptidase (aminopeptidase T)
MYERYPELVDAIRKRFEFAGLKPEHKTAILVNTNSFKPLVDATYAAAVSLGARPVLVVIPYPKLPFPRDIPPLAEEAITAADFLVDMQHLTWFYSKSSDRVLSARRKNGGTGTIVGGNEEDVDTIIANVPTQAKVDRAKKAQAWIDKAKNIRVTTREGTDYTVARGDPKQFLSYPSDLYGQVAFAPPDGTAEGVIVAVGAARIQKPVPERFSIKEPLRMELKAGRISKIDRGTPDGAYMDDWFRSFGRPDAYNYAHVNLGLIPLSIRHVDNEAIHLAYGGVLHGFGIRGTPVFGTPVSDIPNHFDWHMPNASYYVDDVALLKDGKFTKESGLEFSAEELAD